MAVSLPWTFWHEGHQASENDGWDASKTNHVSPAVRNVCESCTDTVADNLTTSDGHVVQTDQSASYFGGSNLGNVERNDHGC